MARHYLRHCRNNLLIGCLIHRALLKYYLIDLDRATSGKLAEFHEQSTQVRARAYTRTHARTHIRIDPVYDVTKGVLVPEAGDP